MQHPDVLDVAVVSMPDPVLGEKACAYVVTSRPALEIDDLREFLTGRGLAVQKCPERVEVVTSLPRTASGKVQKFRLRESIAATLRTEQHTC